MHAQVSEERTVPIPEEIGRRLGIEPGDRLDWTLVEGSDVVLVRRVVDRGALARRLCGLGKNLAPDRDLVAELDAEREGEDQERLGWFGGASNPAPDGKFVPLDAAVTVVGEQPR